MSLCDQTIPYVEICSFPEVGESFVSRCRGSVSGIPGFVRSVHAARDYWRFFGAGAARFRAPHGSVLTVPLSTRSRSRPQCRGGLYVAALQAPRPITVHPRFQVQPARAFGSPMGFSKLPCGTLGRLEGLAGRKWRLGNASAILLDFAPPPPGAGS